MGKIQALERVIVNVNIVCNYEDVKGRSAVNSNRSAHCAMGVGVIIPCIHMYELTQILLNMM